MSLISDFMHLVDEGRKGNNIGLSTGLSKLDKIVYGVQRRNITLIGATSGGGKTTFALYSYVYQPLKQMLGDPRLKIIYISLEMNRETLIAKLLSLYIKDTFGEIIQYKDIFSLERTISSHHYELIQKSMQWLTTVESHLIIYDKPVNSEKMDLLIKGVLNTYGNFEEESKYHIKYTSKYENPYFIVVIDHISLLQVSTGKTLKQEVDDAAAKLIWLKNTASITAIIIQQVNRNAQNIDRRKLGLTELTMADFADSSGTQNAAETIIALNHPFREKLDSCRGYNIEKLCDRFRLVSILKGRFGQSEVAFGTSFYGEIGFFDELPLPNEMTDEQYEEVVKIESIFNKRVEKKEDEPKKEGFSFRLDDSFKL